MPIESNIQNLFPIPVGFYKFPRNFSQEELTYISALERANNMGNKKSSNSYIFNSIELKELYEFCQDCVQDYFIKVYRPKNEIFVKITQSWANYTESGQYHHKHIHPNSFISGVFYIQTDATQDKIHFVDSDLAIHRPFRWPVTEQNIWNSNSWYFDSIPTNLILFPSKLHHFVETRPNIDYDRISISFNTYPVGVIGETEDLTELKLY